jgi:hypothetical protein
MGRLGLGRNRDSGGREVDRVRREVGAEVNLESGGLGREESVSDRTSSSRSSSPVVSTGHHCRYPCDPEALAAPLVLLLLRMGLDDPFSITIA